MVVSQSLGSSEDDKSEQLLFSSLTDAVQPENEASTGRAVGKWNDLDQTYTKM